MLAVCHLADVGVRWWEVTDGAARDIVRSWSLQDFWWDSRYAWCRFVL